MCAQSDKTTKLAYLVFEAVLMVLLCDRVLKELKNDPLDLILRDFVKDLRYKAISSIKN